MTGRRPTPTETTRGFQPAARRRNRIAAGVLLAALAIGGNTYLYATLDDSEPVVQVVQDVPAGERLTGDMLRTVDVDADPTVNLVPGSQLDALVGTHAKVRLVAGSLVTAESVQPGPLVGDGNAVVAIQINEGALPIGLRERVPVTLVIPSIADQDASDPATVPGRVVGLPRPTDSALGVESLSVEVSVAHAATVAAADDVRVVLMEPGADAADGADEP